MKPPRKHPKIECRGAYGRRWSVVKKVWHVARTLVFGSSARARRGQAVIRREEFETGDLIQAGLGETKGAYSDGSVGLNQENAGNELQPIRRRDGVGMMVNQQIECNSVFLGKTAGFRCLVSGHAPQPPTGRAPHFRKN